LNSILFTLLVVAWALSSGSLIVWLYGSKIREFWYYTTTTSTIFGALLVAFCISIPYLLGCSNGECTDLGDLDAAWGKLYEISPGLTTTIQVFIAAFATCGGTIALLDFVPSKEENPNVSFIVEERVLKSLFPESLPRAIRKEMKDFSSAVSSGDLIREVEANAKAVYALLSPIETLMKNGTKLENAIAHQLEKRLFDGIVAFQQEAWNVQLSSSLHFELDAYESILEFGFFKDDLKFGKYTSLFSRKYSGYNSDSPIQVRGERLVIGCNVFQITSETKVKVRQYLDQDQAEVIEIKIRGDRWVLELEAYGFGAFEPSTEEGKQELEDWSEYKSKLNDLVKAVEQVRGALKLVADQKKNSDLTEQLKKKFFGMKFGDWVGVRPLGNGGFGQVWLAEKKAQGPETPSQQVAIKIFSQSDFQSFKQFEAETESLGQLKHPNIAHLIDKAQTGNVFWFATSYVGEVSMGSIVSSGQIVPQKDLQKYATQMFDALAHAHRRGIVHGDVHPGNLVLANDQSAIVLVDFGLSAIGGYRTQETLTHVEYRAPELLGEQTLLDPKNDVYSAAVTILTLARGYSPWKSRENQALLREIKRGSPSLVGLDPTLAGFLAPLLSSNPAQRPSSEATHRHLEAGGFHPWSQR